MFLETLDCVRNSSRDHTDFASVPFGEHLVSGFSTHTPSPDCQVLCEGMVSQRRQAVGNLLHRHQLPVPADVTKNGPL